MKSFRTSFSRVRSSTKRSSGCGPPNSCSGRRINRSRRLRFSLAIIRFHASQPHSVNTTAVPRANTASGNFDYSDLKEQSSAAISKRTGRKGRGRSLRFFGPSPPRDLSVPPVFSHKKPSFPIARNVCMTGKTEFFIQKRNGVSFLEFNKARESSVSTNLQNNSKME